MLAYHARAGAGVAAGVARRLGWRGRYPLAYLDASASAGAAFPALCTSGSPHTAALALLAYFGAAALAALAAVALDPAAVEVEAGSSGTLASLY